MAWASRAVVVALVATSCVSGSTPYGSSAPASLTDEQLIEELEAAARGVGVSINRAQYLMAIRPEPAYVLTSSTTFSGLVSANISAYTMPAGYGSYTYGHVTGTYSGTATTQYSYVDANSFARGMVTMAAAIHAARARAFRDRALAVLDEIQRRMEARQVQAEATIAEFFAGHPNLEPHRTLIAAILPWTASERIGRDPLELLESAGQIARALSRGPGLAGRWYGLFSQRTKLDDGETFSSNSFLYVDLTQDDARVRGVGELGSGEKIEVAGTLDEGLFSGVVVNPTGALTSRVVGIAKERRIQIRFEGAGLAQEVAGTAILLR